ncbi:hypothetical protein NNW97_23820 [Streptomyces parvus]|nr:hypothetical protein [Streptomyces parvus]MCQ1579920.1 hypothetical protein [Streptomyces parvus]
MAAVDRVDPEVSVHVGLPSSGLVGQLFRRPFAGGGEEVHVAGEPAGGEPFHEVPMGPGEAQQSRDAPLTQFGERMVLPPQDVVEDGRGERAVVEGGPAVAEGFEGPQEQFPLVVLLVASGTAEVAVEVGEEVDLLAGLLQLDGDLVGEHAAVGPAEEAVRAVRADPPDVADVLGGHGPEVVRDRGGAADGR